MSKIGCDIIDEIIKIQKRTNVKRTTEQYKSEVSQINKNVEVIGEYINVNTKILHKCKLCNNEYLAYPSNVLKGCGCKKCQMAKMQQAKIGKPSVLRKTHEEFMEDFNKKFSNIEVLDTYINSEHKNHFLCKICGHEWFTTPNSILNSNGCIKCTQKENRKRLALTQDEFVNRINRLHPNIEVLQEYTNNYTRVKVKCNKCNREWEPYPSSLMQGFGCMCNRITITEDEFYKRLQLTTLDITILNEFGDGMNLTCQCNKCCNIWNSNKYYLLREQGCSNCKTESRGEIKVRQYLSDNHIVYNVQKKFDNLKGVGERPLSYDFYLPQYNLLIEFQGIQHKKVIDYFGGEKQFQIQQEHDKRKREYAEMCHINLLEIWYYDINNIETILTKTLNNLKLESVETVIPA